MAASVSPAKLTEQLQALLNETAAAQNYELEAKTVRAYELLCRVEKGLPADESGLSSYYTLFNAWIRWLCVWENFSLNLLHRRRLIGYLNKALGEGRFRLQIYPYASRLYGIRNERGIRDIQLHEAMDYMDDRQCRRFAQDLAASRWKDLKQLLKDYQSGTPQYRELLQFFRDTKVQGEPVNETKGRYYDLETVFQNCNARCFNGKMPRPRGLHWSARVNHSTMGTYNVTEDTVMINRGLDRADVPAYVLDFVMYHELLHKALGIKTVGTRRHAHTPEFRKFERAHPDYQRAQEFIKRFAGTGN